MEENKFKFTSHMDEQEAENSPRLMDTKETSFDEEIETSQKQLERLLHGTCLCRKMRLR